MSGRPEPRRAVIVRMDAPELPFLANLIDAGFTALVHNGWSVLVPDEPVDPAVVAAQQTGPLCIALSSDGSRRSLTVYPEPNDAFPPRERLGFLSELGERTSLRWPAETGAAVRLPDAGAAASGGTSPAEPGPGDVEDAADGFRELDTEIAVASIATLCELDPAETSRLENYAATPSSSLLLESVLQLIGAPAVAAKFVESQRDLADLGDARHYGPGPLGLTLLDAATVEPTGADVLSRVQRAYVRRPGLLLAVGGAQLVAGTALAALAGRGGRGAKALGAASALLFTDAAGQAALWAAVRARRNRH